MITKEDIEQAYAPTTEATRVSLEGALQDEKGEKFNAVYSILQGLNFHSDTAFNGRLIHSDGGVKAFDAIFRMGGYPVVIGEFRLFEYEPPFDTVEGFVDWLNAHVKRVEAESVLQFTKVVH